MPGPPGSFQLAVDSLAIGGRAVAIASMPHTINLTTRHLVYGERVITGSRHSTRAELIETMDIMARGLIKPVIGRRTHFTEVESLFDDIVTQRLLGRGAVTYD